MLYVRKDIPSKLLSIENQPIDGYKDKFEGKEMVALWYI